MSKKRKCLKLFITSLFISTFTFGGGFVIVPLMRKKYVNDLKWLEEKEMLDLTAIAQSTPGAIAVNASILLGYKIAGILGSLVAIIGTILPPMIIISIISFFYNMFKANVVVNAVLLGMQAGVAAVICDVVLNMASGVFKEHKLLPALIMAATFILIFFVKINVVFIILGCIVLSVSISLILHIKKKRDRKKTVVSADNITEKMSVKPDVVDTSGTEDSK